MFPTDEWQSKVNSALWNTEDLWSNWKHGQYVPARSYHWDYEVDWRVPICPSLRSSEMDDNQSVTMATYMKLCWNQPYLMYLISMTAYETSNWMSSCRYRYQRPCHTEYNPNYYSRDQIKCRMAENTMPNTMPITIPNTMPYLFRSYITENTPD